MPPVLYECGLQDAFTTATRHELVGTNIRVSSISPGKGAYRWGPTLLSGAGGGGRHFPRVRWTLSIPAAGHGFGFDTHTLDKYALGAQDL